MKAIVLDTRTVIRDFQQYDPYFSFYEAGLKDLVREAILTRSFNSPYTACMHRGHRYSRGLVSKVIEDFEYAIDRHHDLNTEQSARAIYDMDHAQNNMGVIRFVTGEVEQAADQLLQRHLRTRLFEIAQENAGASLVPRWIGQDLLVFIRLLSPREY